MSNVTDFVPETWAQKHIIDYLRQHPGAIYETIQADLGLDIHEFYRAYRRLRDMKKIEHRYGDPQVDLFLVETPMIPRKARPSGVQHVKIGWRPKHGPANDDIDEIQGW